MSNDRNNHLLGEFLTEAGLLQIEELREAANIARNQGLPIGKVLVMSGYISKETLQAAVEAQSRTRDGLLDYEISLKALTIVSQNNAPLDDALSQLDCPKINITDIDTSNRLGEFLSGARLVSNTDLKTAMVEADCSGLPLGRVLLNLSMISEQVLDQALTMQAMVREGTLTKEQAVKALVVAKERLPASQPLTDGQAASDIERKSGVTLAASEELNNAKDIPQPMGGNGAFLFSNQLNKNEPVRETTSPFVEIDSLSLHHMLRVAGLVETAALEKAILDSLEDPEVMTLILKQTKLLDDFVINAARECCQLIKEGKIKPEQAIIALHHCQRTRNSMHDCLEEFGWLEKPAEMVNT